MLRKVRYHHENLDIPGWKHRGYSVKMSPVDQELVNVQFTFCSANDAFCRKEAREALETKPAHLIPVAELPVFLAGLHGECAGQAWNRPVNRWSANQYAWVWKYFL